MVALFDLSRVDDRTFNHHFECLCKALSEPPADGPGKDDMWTPHPSAFLRSLVEAFTQLGLSASDALKAEAVAWLSGAMHNAGEGGHPLLQGAGPHANGPQGGTGGPTGGFPGSSGGSGAAGGAGPFPLAPSLAWTPAQLIEVRAYLLSKPLTAWSPGDWLLLVDYLVHSHFPPGWAESQGEALATRAGLMGKVEVDHPGAGPEAIDNVLAAMPNTIAGAAALLGGEIPPAYMAALVFGRERAAENIRASNEQLRHAMKSIILQALQSDYSHTAGAEFGASQALQQRLFDAFGEHNRDWRRIAVTEAGEIKNQGFVALHAAGEFIKRVEQYRGACSFCRNLDGRIFKVVDPGDPDKDGAREVWAGKTNVGRSSSPNKRVDGELVPRLSSELWWPASGVQHPHCRGAWVSVRQPLPTSPEKAWKEWLGALGMKAPST